MKILCKYNDLDNPLSGIPNDFDYGLVVGKEYLVMGVVLTENHQLWYLIDENGWADFYPYQLFDITESSVPAIWYFKLYNEDNGVFPFHKKAMWGYYELCFDGNYHEQLVLKEDTAQRIYFKRKIELENLSF